jgi:CheY-like chemotaxis protein
VARYASEVLEQVAGQAVSPDLLITDVLLPDGPGPELARQLEQDYPGTRVLYVSGHTRDVLDRYEISTASHFLRKPFVPRDLVEAVDGLLNGQAARLDADGGTEI